MSKKKVPSPVYKKTRGTSPLGTRSVRWEPVESTIDKTRRDLIARGFIKPGDSQYSKKLDYRYNHALSPPEPVQAKVAEPPKIKKPKDTYPRKRDRRRHTFGAKEIKRPDGCPDGRAALVSSNPLEPIADAPAADHLQAESAQSAAVAHDVNGSSQGAESHASSNGAHDGTTSGSDYRDDARSDGEATLHVVVSH